MSEFKYLHGFSSVYFGKQIFCEIKLSDLCKFYDLYTSRIVKSKKRKIKYYFHCYLRCRCDIPLAFDFVKTLKSQKSKFQQFPSR